MRHKVDLGSAGLVVSGNFLEIGILVLHFRLIELGSPRVGPK